MHNSCKKNQLGNSITYCQSMNGKPQFDFHLLVCIEKGSIWGFLTMHCMNKKENA